jgi:hypothetical protein
MECELGSNGEVFCSDGRRFRWRQGLWVQIWPPSGAAAAGETPTAQQLGNMPDHVRDGEQDANRP